MKTKKMFCVERYDVLDDHKTSEIFPRLKTALEFAKELQNWQGVHIPLYISLNVYNAQRIFKDERSGLQVWNYDDYGDTVLKETDFRIVFNNSQIDDNLWQKIENCPNNGEIKKLFNYESSK